LTNQENVPIKVTGMSRLSTTSDWIWQRSDNGGVTWSDITISNASTLDAGITYSGFSGRGGTTSTLIISKADPKIHGFQYKLKLIGTSFGHFIETNPSVLTVADVFGVCATGSLPIQLISSSAAKTGLTTLANTAFVSDDTKLNDGNTQTGMVVTNSTTENITSSLSFDGSNDQVLIGKPNSIQALKGAITVEAWVRPTSSFGSSWDSRPIIGKSRHFNLLLGSYGVIPSLTSNNQLQFWVEGSTGYNALTRFTGGGWLFNQTTSAVTTQTASAAVEINGTAGAVLFPRLTTTERNPLTPTYGIVIYNTTDNKFQV
jgi:hypothetical protein